MVNNEDGIGAFIPQLIVTMAVVSRIKKRRTLIRLLWIIKEKKTNY